MTADLRAKQIPAEEWAALERGVAAHADLTRAAVSMFVPLPNGKKVAAPLMPPLPNVAGPRPGNVVAHDIHARIRKTHPKSPLLGASLLFVKWGNYFMVGPRLVAAIAGQETEYGTTGNAAAIHNAFGWGPGIEMRTWEHGIYRVARGLRAYYLNTDRNTIVEIGELYAPTASDTSGLNRHWIDGVTSIYRAMGGSGYGV